MSNRKDFDEFESILQSLNLTGHAWCVKEGWSREAYNGWKRYGTVPAHALSSIRREALLRDMPSSVSLIVTVEAKQLPGLKQVLDLVNASYKELRL